MKKTLIALLLCFLATFAFRYAVCQMEVNRLKSATGADFAPFQVESAIAYAQIRAIAVGEADAGVLATASAADLSAKAQLAGGMEDFLGGALWLKRAITGSPIVDGERATYEDNPGDAAWIRLVLCGWAALLAPLIFLWMWWGGVSRPWAFLAAMLYAVMPAAVARYTGQELLKGAFALPFVVAWLAVWTRTVRIGGAGRWGWRYGIIALLAGLGAANWDMAQIVFGAWGVCEIVRILVTAKPECEHAYAALATWCGLILAGVLSAYGRAHGSVLSPVVLGIFPAVAVLNLFVWKRRNQWLWVVLLAVVWFAAAWNSPFAANYEHFRELLVAKIRFCNIKPEDPTLLNFSQRFLWTPELHSADWRTVLNFFPGVWWVAWLMVAVGVCVAKWRREWRACGELGWYCWALSVAFFVAFIFMVRFHELAAVFLAPWFGMLCQVWWRTAERRRALAVVIFAVLVALVCEVDASAFQVRAYPPQMKTQAALARMARSANLAGEVVLADLEWGSLLAGYGQCALVVQPKFELKTVRDEVQKYVELLYTGSEEALAEFCERHQVQYLFFRRMASVEQLHVDSYRYMAAATEIPPDAAILKMDWKPGRLKFFRQVVVPGSEEELGGVRVFRYVTEEQHRRAAELLEEGLAAYYRNNRPLAHQLLYQAYRIDPVAPEIFEAYFRLTGNPPPPYFLTEELL